MYILFFFYNLKKNCTIIVVYSAKMGGDGWMRKALYETKHSKAFERHLASNQAFNKLMDHNEHVCVSYIFSFSSVRHPARYV